MPLHHFTILVIFDTIVIPRSEIFNTNNDEFIGVAILRLSHHHQDFCVARLHTSTVGNVKIARSEKSYYCYIHMPIFPIVWLLRDLSLGGKWCMRVDKNAVSV